jgi:hypothetical protein
MEPDRKAGSEPAGLGGQMLTATPGLAERAINAAALPDDEVGFMPHERSVERTESVV